ncbi:hypothetical protein LAV73_20695 [Lysinibacillus xylanilyticus]|uniref:hypothetical protein n=1 Tax=Lysinibacillus xylanilyticus TaxID=582475 RepID=UPI002B24A3C0|nr:hypothetical protein [Lysinibacillus xylanilyticus]MEB2282373.1 hypothetical protein [Lysinibacillus xylanilyticus]
MNLRQKINQAKKELRGLEKAATYKTNLNYQYYKRKKELSDLVNTKRQLNSYTNDEKIQNEKYKTNLQHTFVCCFCSF